MTSIIIRKILIVSMSLLLLTGCVTVQTSPAVTKTSHVAIISAVGSSATYQSLSLLQRSETPIPLRNFDIDSSIAAIAKQSLNNLGYQNVTIINLPQNNIITSRDIYNTGWSTVNFKPEVSQYIEQLIANKNIDSILLFTRGGACPPNVNCDTDAVFGFGIYDRSILGINNGFTYAALTAVILDPKSLNNLETESESNFDYSHAAQVSKSYNALMPDDLNYLKSWVATSYRMLTPKVVQDIKMLTSSANYNKVTF